jgi:hypothetical protein
MIICKFAACETPASMEVRLVSECGHKDSRVFVCTEHSTPGKSPNTHRCPTCGQHVHMLREI